MFRPELPPKMGTTAKNYEKCRCINVQREELQGLLPMKEINCSGKSFSPPYRRPEGSNSLRSG